MSLLPTIFDTCIPREEVLAGELPDSIFAADLWNVVNEELPPESYQDYRDPRRFFAHSYPTESMKLLLQDVSARLAGAPGANPVFRLETGFGGGKTHNIIAAVHVAREGAGLADFLTEYGVERLPAPGLVGVAAFVGDQADPVSGIRHGTGEQTIRTYTPWGEIAYQLGGVEGYRLIQENDVQGIAPSRQALADICGERPVLIVLDELVLYFARVLALREDYPRRNVVRQMPIFLQTLFTFAAKDRNNAVVIFTLPSEQDANRHVTAELKQVIPQLLEAVGEMEDISNRQARNLTPTQSYERAAVLARRLFRSVDRKPSADVASAYFQYYEEQFRQGIEIDPRALDPSYKEQIRVSYPFHPELIRLFAERLASIHEFHATRGALRLMARTIRAVWNSREKWMASLLFHPCHIDLGRGSLRDELLARLGRQNFAPALEADVIKTGGVSHAALVEQGWPVKAATESATVVLLHSLPAGSRGLLPGEVALSVGRPGYDLAYVKKALEETARIGWYLDVDAGGRYLFKDRATLNKRFQERATGVGWAEIKEELDAWIASVYSGFEHFEVIFFPESHLDIPDTADRLRLVIIHYDKECGYVGHGERLSFTASLLARTGVSGSPRVYRNNIVFLLAQEGRVGALKEAVRDVLAWARVKEDLLNEQRQMAEAAGQDLRIWKEAARRGAGGVPPEFLALERDLEKTELHRGEAELGVRSRLLEAYRVLACPPVPGRDDDLFFSLRPPLECYRVDFGESALRRAVARGQRVGPRPKEQVAEGPILECLRREARKLVAEATPDNPVVLAPALICQEPLWRAGDRSLSTQEIWERLRKDPDLPMVLRPQDILPSFRAGLFISPEVLWYYYDQSSKRTYTRETANDLSPIISSAHFLYKPQAALEDRILPPSLITTEEFWQNVWPRENGSPAKHFAADQILEQMRNSDYFRVLPEPDVIWQTVREGVRENRWVLYFANNDLVFGARELAELPASPQLYQTVQLWEYQAALEAGIYPRRGTDQTEAREISAAVLKARCWPLGAEQISTAALERAAREIWPDLGRHRFQELLEEGGRLGLWGLWVKDAQENYYTAEDSLPDVAVGGNFFLVAPESALARRLDAFRPGRKPQPVSATGTPREVMTAIWEQLSSQKDIVIEEMVLEVNSREALDGTIAATWPDRPANTKSQCQLLVAAERSTTVNERLKVEYTGRFEELRNVLAPAWPFALSGALEFTVVITHTFHPALNLDAPELTAYRDALMNANQGLINVKAIPARSVRY